MSELTKGDIKFAEVDDKVKETVQKVVKEADDIFK